MLFMRKEAYSSANFGMLGECQTIVNSPSGLNLNLFFIFVNVPDSLNCFMYFLQVINLMVRLQSLALTIKLKVMLDWVKLQPFHLHDG